MEEEEVDLTLDPREYTCGDCNLVHWTGAADFCDRPL
jgi:hypothetical protein